MLIAVDNRNFRLTLHHKLMILAEAIKPGFTYEELLDVISNDEEIPEQYVSALEANGIKFPDSGILIETDETTH